MKHDVKKMKELFEALFGPLPTACVACDAGGNIVSANKAAYELLPMKKKDIADSKIDEILDIDPEFITKSLSGEEYSDIAATFLPDPEVKFSLTIYPLRGGDKIRGVVICVEKRAEADSGEQERSSELYRSLSESALVGIYIYDEGRFLYVNKHMERITGYTAAELLDLDTSALIPPGERAHLAELVEKRKQGLDRSPNYTFRIIRKDGKESCIEVYTRRIGYQGREVTLGHCMDITRTRRDHDALSASERMYRSTINSMGDMIHVTDRDFRIVTHNLPLRMWTANLGIILADVVGKSLFEVFPFLPTSAREEYQQVWKYGKPILSQEQMRVKEKTVITETRKIPVKNNQGKVDRVVTVIRDITGAKQSESALKVSEKRYRTLQTNVPVGIFRSTPSGEILSVNPALVNMLGYSSEEELLEISAIETYVIPERRAELVRRMDGENEVADFEVELEHKDGGKIWVSLSAKAVKDTAGKVLHYDGIIEDITDRKKAQEEVERHSAELSSLLDISTTVSATLDEREVVNLIAERATQLIGADGCTIYRLDATSKELIPRTTTITRDRDKRMSFNIPVGKGITGRAALERKPIIANNAHQDKRAITIPGTRESARCLLVTPLLAHGDMWGVMTLVRFSEVGFTNRDLELFALFANQVADAAVNSRLFSRLAESEEKYRSFVEQATDAIFIVQGYRVVFANRAAHKLLGYGEGGVTEDGLAGSELEQILAPEDRDKVLANYRKRMRGEDAGLVYDTKLLSRKGKFIDVEFNVGLISFQGKAADLVFARDIRERKQAEEAIRESEEKYSNLFQRSNDAIFIHDFEGNMVDVNEKVLELFGYKRKEILALGISDLHPSEALDDSKEAFKQVARDGFVNFEIEFKRSSGEVFPAEVSSSIFEIGGTRVVQGIVRDITERRQKSVRQKVRAELLDNLRQAKNIEECLRLGCETVRDAGLFSRALITIQDEARQIIHLGQVGLTPEQEAKIRKMSVSDRQLLEKVLRKQFKINQSYFIPAEAGVDLGRVFRHLPQESSQVYKGKDAWQVGDKLLVPVLTSAGKVESYLSMDTPLNGKRPDKEIVLFLEDIVDVVFRQIHEIRSIDALLESETRYRSLFEDSPISLWEEDLSEVKRHLDELKKNGVKDFKEYFDAHPEEVMRCASLARAIDVNRVTLDLYRASSKEDLLGGFDRIFTAESYELAKEELIAIAQGKPVFEGEGINQTLNGERMNISLRLTAAPGFEKSLSKVLISIVDITERKRVEEALRESEEFSRAVMERSPLGISVRSPTGQLLSVNDAWKRIWAVPDEDVARDLSRTRKSLKFNERDSYLASWHNEVRRIYEAGGYLFIPEVQTTGKRAGSAKWVSHHFYAIKDSEGKVNRVVILTEDITERKHAEQALRKSEERYRELFRQANDAIFVERLDGPIAAVNHRACEWYGYSEPELLKMKSQDLVSPQFASTRPEFIAKLKEEGSFLMEEEALRRDGSTFTAEVSGRLISWDDEDAVLVFVRDTTERKLVEEAMREGERFLTSIFSSIQDGLSILDKNMNIIRVNSTMEKWFPHGMPLIGKKCYQVYHGRSKMCENCPTKDTIKTGESAYEIVPKLGKDGKVEGWFDLYSFPLVDVSTGKMQGIIEYVRDITDSKLAEEALRGERQTFSIIGQAAASAKDIPDLCNRILTGLVETLDFDAGSVQLYDSDERLLRLQAITGFWVTEEKPVKVEDIQHIDDPKYVATHVARTMEPIFAPDIRQDEIYKKFQTRLDESEIAALVSWPISGKDEKLLGVIHLASRSPMKIPPENTVFFETIVYTFATALERKHAEQALQESEEKYRSLVERANDGITILQDGIILFTNQRLASMLGYQPEEMEGTLYQTYIDPVELPKVSDRYQRRMAGEDVPSIYETGLIHKKGEMKEVELNAGVIQYQGRPADLVFIRDITERKQAEQALREREELYRTLVNTAQEAICLVDSVEKFIYVNPKMTELLGYSPEELIGHDLLNFVDDDEKENIRKQTSKRLRGRTSRYESSLVCRDGSIRRVLVNAAPIFDGEGNFYATMGILTDITDIKNAEAELRLRLTYQMALAKIMNRAIRLENFESFVDDCLGVLGETTQAKRVYLAANQDKNRLFSVAHEWKMKEASSILGRSFDYKDVGNIKKRLEADEVIAGEISRLTETEAALFAEHDVKSVFMAPLYLQTGLYGFIGFEDDEPDRSWNDIEIEVLRTTVRLIGTIIDRYFEQQERHLAEEALSESEQRYRTLVETSSDVIFLLLPSGDPLYVSPAVKRLGYSPEQIVSKEIIPHAIPADEMMMLQAVFEKTKKDGVPAHDVDCEVFDRDGQRHWFAINWNWIKDEQGKILAVQGMARDISERKDAEQALRLRMEYEKSLFEISSLFLSEGVSEAAVEEFLERLGRVTEVSRVSLYSHEQEEDGRGFLRRNWHWVSEEYPKLDNDYLSRIHYSEGFERWLDALSTGEKVQNAVRDLPLGERKIFEAEGIKAILVLPIFVEGRYWGVIGFDEASQERDWNVEDVRLLWTASQILSSALATRAKAVELAKSYENLSERERQITEINLKLVQAEEEERRRIARVLHDEIAQQLTGVALELSVPELNDDRQGKEHLDRAKGMVKETQKFIRDLSYELRPPVIDNLGLGAAVRAMARITAQGSGVSIVVEGEDTFPRTDTDTEITLFRIVQEAVTNSLKHAEPDEIVVRFGYQAPTLRVTITDDGKGFDVDEVLATSTGMGIRSIQERMSLIGGRIKLSSIAGKGSEVKVEVEITPKSDTLVEEKND